MEDFGGYQNPYSNTIDVEKEKGVTFESARKSLADYQHLIKQCAVRSEDLDSDGDEDRRAAVRIGMRLRTRVRIG